MGEDQVQVGSMPQESNWEQLCKPQFVDRDINIKTLFGMTAEKAGRVASGVALISTFLVIPAVFMAASKDANLKSSGIWLGYIIWATFVAETLVFIRLEKGWGGSWLKKHWLQLVVIFAASPFTAIVLEHAIMPLVAMLFSVQSFISLAYLSKLVSGVKVIKLLHLEEARRNITKSVKRIRWLYKTTLASISFCALGILGSAASGNAATPLHGLKMWWLLLEQAISVAPELFVVSLPVVAIIGGFALMQNRWSQHSSRQGS